MQTTEPQSSPFTLNFNPDACTWEVLQKPSVFVASFATVERALKYLKQCVVEYNAEVAATASDRKVASEEEENVYAYRAFRREPGYIHVTVPETKGLGYAQRKIDGKWVVYDKHLTLMSSFATELEALKYIQSESATNETTEAKATSTTAGRKDDIGKVMMHLLIPSFLRGVASVLTFGANKYQPRNWEKGIKYSRVYAALLRHVNTWWEGERNDPETGIHHLYHAACCIMFLVTYDERGMGQEWNDHDK